MKYGINKYPQVLIIDLLDFYHRLHSTDSKFQSFLSQNLPNNMGDLCKILIQNGRRFITHSPTISTPRYVL